MYSNGQIQLATEAPKGQMPESKNRKNRSRYQPTNQLNAGSPELPEPSEMDAIERTIRISELTFRQQSVMPILAVSRSIAQAARDSGVAESTLRRWLSEPLFREELDRIRRESLDLSRQQLEAVLPACISAMAETALQGENPSLRFRAQRFLINLGTRSIEAGNLSVRVGDLLQALDLGGKNAPPT